MIHLGEPIDTSSNISEAQIHWAIQGLSNRFSGAMGSGADTGLRFCLASCAPDGRHHRDQPCERIVGTGIYHRGHKLVRGQLRDQRNGPERPEPLVVTFLLQTSGWCLESEEGGPAMRVTNGVALLVQRSAAGRDKSSGMYDLGLGQVPINWYCQRLFDEVHLDTHLMRASNPTHWQCPSTLHRVESFV